jgi:hypothetical protein
MLSMPTLEEDLTGTFQEVRGSLQRLLDAAGVDLAEPGKASRALGLNRNLLWKLAKVLGEVDIYTALQHLPGEEGLEIVTRAMERVGVGAGRLAEFAAALARFKEVVRVHAGDFNTLELILDSMGGVGSAERLEQSRKLAFRGNSGLWGLQAKARSTTTLIAPSRENPSMLDLAIVGGVVDFRRLRPGIRWPLFRPRQYHDDGTPISVGPREEPIDASCSGPESPMLIRAFCSANLPDIRATRSPLGWDYEMGDGPVGNLGAFTCFFGRIVRQATSRWRSALDPYLDLLAHISMPTETLLFDVLVHQDLPELSSPKVMLFAATDSGGPGRSDQAIPIEARPAELSGRPPIFGTQLIPRYDELVAMILSRGGWNIREFRALRLTIKYPPMHAVAVLRSELLPPPTNSG